MALKDQLTKFLQHLRQGPYDEENGRESNLANGGYTGYHPKVEKKQKTRTGNPQQMQTPQGNYTGNVYAQTGFTAQNGYPAGAMQNAASQQDWQSAYIQTGYQGNFQQAGYQGNFQQPGYQGNFQQAGFTASQAQAAFQQQPMNWQQGGFQTPVQEAKAPDNLRYFPGSFVADDGTAFRMVERLTQPVSAASCYRLIEFMRNGESIIVNTELIQDEYEITRCLDLLYGAAFTMGYTFTRISSRSIYLISPSTVMVMPYESLRQLNEQDAAQRWPGSTKESVGFGQDRAQRRGNDFRGRESVFSSMQRRSS